MIQWLIVTTLFIVLDTLCGFTSSIKNGTFKSSIMREGLFHKVGSLFALILGFLCSYSSKYVNLGINDGVFYSICVYIIVMEMGSIIENIGKINPNIVPAKLKQYFGTFTNEKDGGEQ